MQLCARCAARLTAASGGVHRACRKLQAPFLRACRALLDITPELRLTITQTPIGVQARMSAKAISEKSGKELLAKVGVIDEALVVAVDETTKLDDAFLQAHPWLQTKVGGSMLRAMQRTK